MSQPAVTETRPYRGLVLDTRARPVACLRCGRFLPRDAMHPR